MQLALSNIINVSISASQTGLGEYNTSNLACFTSETPLAVWTEAFRIYKTASDVATDFGSSSMTYKIANNVFSQSPNILSGGGSFIAIPLLALEKIDAAITRTAGLVQYFGIVSDKEIADADILLAAAVIQPIKKMAFFAKRLAADLTTGGVAEDIVAAKYSHTRILGYLTDATTDAASVLMAAAYAGRALSTNFGGNNTTQTMHLKDLVGVKYDENMTQTILTNCQTNGVDVYASFQGVPKTFCSSANQFFDDVYNDLWFVGDLEVRGFNYLAQSNSKIPQTEQGMDGLKGAYRGSCEQGLVNNYLAAGSWTSPDTFGNPEDFKRNIFERGYYIYSLPVNKQSSADREDRKAPLIQIAAKRAGAIHNSTVVVNINA